MPLITMFWAFRHTGAGWYWFKLIMMWCLRVLLWFYPPLSSIMSLNSALNLQWDGVKVNPNECGINERKSQKNLSEDVHSSFVTFLFGCESVWWIMKQPSRASNVTCWKVECEEGGTKGSLMDNKFILEIQLKINEGRIHLLAAE